MNVNFMIDKPYALETPIPVVEGESLTFACTYWAAPTSVSAKAYRNGQDVSATVFPSGSITISGNTATLKPATGFIGGGRYVIAVTGTVEGDVLVRKILLIVSKDEAE